MLNSIVIIVASIIFSSLGHIFFKKGMMSFSGNFILSSDKLYNTVFIALSSPWLIAGMVLHVIALLTWLVALRQVDITFAYPFLALGYVIVSVIAWLWLGEQITYYKIIGMLVIMIGLLILSRS
jgi:drug/metabolite transporter (DMT)-like permease